MNKTANVIAMRGKGASADWQTRRERASRCDLLGGAPARSVPESRSGWRQSGRFWRAHFQRKVKRLMFIFFVRGTVLSGTDEHDVDVATMVPTTTRCHCANSEPCHRNILIKVWKEKFLDTRDRELRQEPAGAEESFRAAKLNTTAEEPESQSEDKPGQETRGSGWRGRGRPMMIGRGTKARELHDGAGLCSLGHWILEQKHLPENEALGEFREMIKKYVRERLSSDLLANLVCERTVRLKVRKNSGKRCTFCSRNKEQKSERHLRKQVHQ